MFESNAEDLAFPQFEFSRVIQQERETSLLTGFVYILPLLSVAIKDSTRPVAFLSGSDSNFFELLDEVEDAQASASQPPMLPASYMQACKTTNDR